MKPRNKVQFEISRLAECLPGLTKDHSEWAKLNCFMGKAIRRKNGDMTCTLCGHQWQSESWLADSATGVDCPHCKSNLKVLDSKKRVIDEISYMTIADAIGEYQVLRNFLVTKKFRIGEKASIDIIQVVQTWFDENGKCIPIAKARRMNSSYGTHPFALGGDMNFRSKIIDEYKIWGEVYPTMKITNELKKRGLKSFHGCNPYHLVKQLLTNDIRAEQLIKTGQYDLLIAYTSTSRERDVIHSWNQVRIATKHKYIVDDPIMWLDYLRLLAYERKDLNNPHFICPENLKAEHDRYMAKRRKREAEQERIRKIQEAEKVAKQYKGFEERVKRFIGLRFADEDIEIVPLSSIDEFRAEGDMMHHCVFINKYFTRTDCLILSARIGNEHIETVEVDLKKWQVVQSRGRHNCTTPYHDQIVNLVNQNINQIRKIA